MNPSPNTFAGANASNKYSLWLSRLRQFAQLIRQERESGRSNREMAMICRPLLTDLNRAYDEVKAEMRASARRMP